MWVVPSSGEEASVKAGPSRGETTPGGGKVQGRHELLPSLVGDAATDFHGDKSPEDERGSIKKRTEPVSQRQVGRVDREVRTHAVEGEIFEGRNPRSVTT